jgi:DNA-binding transcriptional LysR family regulator
MAHLDDIAVFVSVVDQGSFSGAARRLKLPPTTVSRRIKQLEDRLGVRLLHRTTRSLALTEHGKRYYETCRDGLGLLEDADRAARGTQVEPVGTIRISAPVNFGATFFADPVVEFLRENPRAKAELILSDERLDLVALRIDVALRIGDLPDSTVVARRLGPARRLFCASRSYLAARGTPQGPNDLKHHDCIVGGNSTTGVSWPFRTAGGEVESIAISGRVSTNVVSIALDAAVAGLGIALLPEAPARLEIAAGRLTEVLSPFVVDRGGLHLVFPSNRNMSAVVRAFSDHVVDWTTHRLTLEG